MGIIGKTGGKGGESKGNTNAGNPSNVNSTTNGTICPAGWRLPQGRDRSTGSNVDTNNEWAILNGSMNTGFLSVANTGARTGYMENWQPNATTGGNDTWRSSYGTVSSGGFDPGNGLHSQSMGAYWWTSSLDYTANATTIVNTYLNPGTIPYGERSDGMAVRCVMDSDAQADPAPQPAPTPGTYDFSVDGPGGWYTKTGAYTYEEPPQPLQTLTLAQCANMPMGSIKKFYDERDKKVYHVRKMPDEKCWMMDNLAYAGGTSNGGSNYFGDEHALTFANATSASPWTTATGITTRFVTTNNHTGSDQNSSGGQLIQNTTGNLTDVGDLGAQCRATPTTYGGDAAMTSACLSYLYNFCSAAGLDSTTTPTCAAATNTGAGTGYATTGVIGKAGGEGGESKGNTNAGNPSNVNSATNGTICPAGWRLPRGRDSSSGTNDTKNEWAILNGSMRNNALSAADTTSSTETYPNWQPNATTGGNATWRSSFGTVSSGYFGPQLGLGGQSTLANWWSSSLSSNTYAYSTKLNDSQWGDTVGAGIHYIYKYYGFAVRCVMDYTPTYLQELTLDYYNTLSVGDTITLKDARDNKSYHLKKMPDNKLWMMDNLAYAGGISNGGTNTYGDSHTLTFANATTSSSWDSSNATRVVTTNNFTGSDALSSGGQMIQNTTGTLNSGSGTQCTANVTGSSPMNSKCLSYLYNWCSAVGLDSTTTPTCVAATNTGTGTGVIGKQGGKGGESKGNANAGHPSNVNSTTSGTICPAGWRLPQGADRSTGSIINNTNNEWAILNGSMRNGTLSAADTTSSAATYPNWQPNATTGGNETWRSSFGTVSSGSFLPGVGLYGQSVYVYWWSSSLHDNNNGVASDTYVNSAGVSSGTDSFGKYSGFAVRCTFP